MNTRGSKQLEWTPERIEIVRRMRDLGNTCREIAMFISDGCTVSGVTGICKRMKIRGPQKNNNREPRDKPQKKSLTKAKQGWNFKRPKPGEEVQPQEIEPILDLPNGVPIWDVSVFGCKWMDDRKFYCNEPTTYGSYCEKHATIVYLQRKKYK